MKIARITSDGKLETFDGRSFTRGPKPSRVRKSDFDVFVEGKDDTPIADLFESAGLEAARPVGTEGIPTAEELVEKLED